MSQSVAAGTISSSLVSVAAGTQSPVAGSIFAPILVVFAASYSFVVLVAAYKVDLLYSGVGCVAWSPSGLAVVQRLQPICSFVYRLLPSPSPTLLDLHSSRLLPSGLISSTSALLGIHSSNIDAARVLGPISGAAQPAVNLRFLLVKLEGRFLVVKLEGSNPLNTMVQTGKKDTSAFKGRERELLKLRKRNLKKGKLKEEKSDTQSPKIDQSCSGNGDDLKATIKAKKATAAGKARNKLLLKKKRKTEKLSQGDLDSAKKKKRREKISQDNLDITKKKKGEKKSEGKTKKASSREKKSVGGDKSLGNKHDAEEETIEEISLVDEDCSRGMKKWLLDYRQRRPGLEVLQQRIDEFIAAHEAEQEQAREERETLAAEGGWTVVVHHKGRKKTTDSESEIAVGSVAQATVEDKMAKKKQKELALDFYRFQKREAQRNEVMMLRSKFEQDKKRLQQLRAARKFRPY